MGGFEEHFRAGIIAAFFAGAVVASYGLGEGFTLDVLVIVTAGTIVAVLIGSLIPDIDVHSSIPRRYVGRLFTIISVLLAGGFAAGNPETTRMIGQRLTTPLGREDVSVEFLGGLTILLSGIVAAKVAGYLLDALTTHRGFTHSIQFAVLFGAAIFVGATQLPQLALLHAGILGGAGTVGVLVHTAVVDR